jgi:hypothetical protein
VSYSFVVQAKDNVLTVSGQTAEVPDGNYQVNGHEDDTSRSITVTRTDDSPYVVAQATGIARRA